MKAHSPISIRHKLQSLSLVLVLTTSILGMATTLLFSLRMEYQNLDRNLMNSAQVLAQSPDVIFTSVSYADKAAQIMKQARALGYEGAFFGGDTLDAPELYSIAGDAAVGSVFTTFYDAAQPATEKTSEFLDAYRAKYGKEPAAPTVMAYDAYLTMRNAIETAGTTDAEAVRDALFTTDGFVGAAGTITLDENHDAVRSVVFKVVEADGSTVFKDMIEP